MDKARGLADGLIRIAHIVVIVSVIWGCQPIPKADEPTSRPGGNPEVSRTHGEELYLRHCAACHGATGTGDGYAGLNPPPADLGSAKVQTQLAPQLIKTVHEGRPDTAMGAWRHMLSDQEIEEVVAHLHTFRQ
ncbi:MAG: c-type cytochrome [Nitrospiraceae bacterium]